MVLRRRQRRIVKLFFILSRIPFVKVCLALEVCPVAAVDLAWALASCDGLWGALNRGTVHLLEYCSLAVYVATCLPVSKIALRMSSTSCLCSQKKLFDFSTRMRASCSFIVGVVCCIVLTLKRLSAKYMISPEFFKEAPL